MLNAIGIGEVLWDLLPTGKLVGGAPSNFAYHTQQQGASSCIVSAVGNDSNGNEIKEALLKKNLTTDYIQTVDYPTGTVDVNLNSSGEPSYSINENVAWDYISLPKNIDKQIKHTAILCFGSLAQRNAYTRNSIKKIIQKVNDDCLIVFDINIRQSYYNKEIIQESLAFCNVLKLNVDELAILRSLLNLKGLDDKVVIEKLMKQYNLKLVALTYGSKGSVLMTPNNVSQLKTPKINVLDTIGAGDSFTATMAMEFVKDKSLDKVHQRAIEVSSFVCQSNGAMPDYNNLKNLK
jgi:fructokinase